MQVCMYMYYFTDTKAGSNGCRIVDAFIFGCRSRHEKESNRQKRLYERMMDEDVDGVLLRMFEAFMQAAPQLVLQLYIMTQLKLDAGPFVGASSCSLSGSLSWQNSICPIDVLQPCCCRIVFTCTCKM